MTHHTLLPPWPIPYKQFTLPLADDVHAWMGLFSTKTIQKITVRFWHLSLHQPIFRVGKLGWLIVTFVVCLSHLALTNHAVYPAVSQMIEGVTLCIHTYTKSNPVQKFSWTMILPQGHDGTIKREIGWHSMDFKGNLFVRPNKLKGKERRLITLTSSAEQKQI